jgi:AbrB family looped-hinge helix DNA binding protein
MRTTIDRAGRIVIPRALRDEIGLEPGEVEVSVDNAAIRIQPLTADRLVEKGSRMVVPRSEDGALTDDVVQALRDADRR